MLIQQMINSTKELVQKNRGKYEKFNEEQKKIRNKKGHSMCQSNDAFENECKLEQNNYDASQSNDRIQCKYELGQVNNTFCV